MFVMAGAVVSVAMGRNAIASRGLIPVPASVAADESPGRQPPAGDKIAPGSDHTSIVPFARNAQGMLARNVAVKALYALGDFGRLVPGAGAASGLIFTWCAALIGAGRLMWGHVPDGLHGPARVLPAALSLGHFFAVTLLSALPFYVLLLPYAAVGMMGAIDFLVPPEDSPDSP
jgi:hypothetical protein